ncbi:S-DNA-T family DNA segregation ATPase FtsK/SpoIIIE [Arthrobacter globiformis]|uniref:FtsK/SpoIIIE domain-containing protein n=1 Tax=Arthrobacter globiformis TaxID=1665 RepID=UPI0027886A42|nr:FtsK/SpoIIIE domain-containing protein [Arthrobacter globiformis]MDQ1059379.1 S-DNA-T family DNA segregation ATPase FtsK/SpoIIIE [Arthrobacter globiformis]
MELQCTLVRAPGAVSAWAGSLAGPVELTVAAPDGCPGTDLEAELSHRFQTRGLTVAGLPLRGLTLGRAPLVNGAVLVDGHADGSGSGPGIAGEPPAAVLLAVDSGPAAGSVLPLRRGSYRIGRTNAELTVPDADLSREHATIEVSDTALTLVDLGSINGTEVDGKRVTKTTVTIGSRIRCGNSSMSVVLAAPSDARDADLGFAGRPVTEPLAVSRPAAPAGRSVLVLGAVLPVIMGVGLVLVTGSWMFLAFTAVSAVTLLVPVVSGARQRRELRSAVAAAAAQDLDRRRRSAPSAAVLALGAALPGWSPAGTGRNAEPETAKYTDDPGPMPARGVWLRLGLADQLANIRLEPDQPGFKPPRLGAVPLLLDPDLAVVSVRGPDSEVHGLAHSFLMQLTGYPLARGTRLAIHGPASVLPLAARFLPGVSLHSRIPDTTAALTDTSGGEGVSGILLLFGGTADGTPEAGIIATAQGLGWRVVHLLGRGQRPAETDIELGERGALLRARDSCHRFVADLVPSGVFDRYCRTYRQSLPDVSAGGQSMPPRCGLGDLLDQSAAATAKRWAAGRLKPGLTVPLGRTAGGLRVLDLEADGPHVLVAGTTGSGKSELLRTITAGLALCYPPDRVNVLFFDFKGGSGLSPLTDIPHCVGMLTDLASSQLERTIVSLRAEVRRREQLLAAANVPDVAAYRLSPAGGPPLPQLILIIDEFRMLVEDAPETLTELMRIAAIGRSLGIHLIMATQRPQGALTADIRANVTTSIALRVQSPHESADVVGTNAASAIPVNRPGRAYLARGAEAAEEFQAASIAATDDGSGSCRVRVLETIVALAMTPAATGSSPPPATPSDAARPVVELAASLWAGTGGSAARRPVAPPLPDVLAGPADVAALTADGTIPAGPVPVGTVPGTAGDWAVGLGLLDLPEEQRLAALTWRPGADGHLALIGAGSRDAAQAMSTAMQQLLSHPTECHLYVLDADGSLTGLAGAQRIGSLVNLHDLRRGVRVLERLATEMSQRLSRLPAASGPPLVLVISGWGSWLSALRAGPLTRAEDHVQDIVRDGRPAGITVVICGDRELVTSRFFPAIPNRIYCPRGTSAESRLAWPKMPDLPPLPGRAVASGSLSAGRQAVCQLYAPEAGRAGHGRALAPGTAVHGPVRVKPFRVDPLPVQLSVADVLSRLPAPESGSGAPDAPVHGYSEAAHPVHAAARRLVVGMGGDEPAPAAVRLPGGAVLAVLGSASSGKSSFLASLPGLNPSGPGWLHPGPEPSPADFWAEAHRNAVEGRLPRDAVLLVDDADMLPATSHQHLVELNTRGWAVIFSAAFSQSLLQRVPLALAARSGGRGILIAPRSPLDGDLFGLRIEPDSHPPPGRALLVADGTAMPVQLALAEDVRRL